MFWTSLCIDVLEAYAYYTHMEFLKLVKKRCSVRKFSAQPVSRKELEACLEAARLAPSACNSQPWHFVVVDDEKLLAEMREAAVGNPVPINVFVRQAPVIIAVVEEAAKLAASIGGFIKGHGYKHLDIGMAVENFCLAATERGIGTCILGWFDEKRAKKALGVPKGKNIPLLIAVGYPVENFQFAEKKRRELSAIVSYNGYTRIEADAGSNEETCR